MDLLICKNCDTAAEGKYCSNCGQKKNTVRLDWNYIQEEVKYTFLHINKGLLYTSKQLLTRPGDMVKDFIEGKRVNHYKPILFVFVLAGLNGLLNHYLDMEKLFKSMTPPNQPKNMPFNTMDIYNWISNHYALFELCLLPVISLCSWLAFRKWGYNYVENIIINSYATGLRLLFGLIIFPIQYFVIRGDLFLLVTPVLGLISMGLTIWLYVGLYKGRDLGNIILRLLLMGFYFMVVYILAIIATVIYLVSQKFV